ncbi:MAG: phage portal protein [Paludibacter sp.]
MTIEEILLLAEMPEKMITELKNGRLYKLPDIESSLKAIEPEKHAVFDAVQRPDKIVKDNEGNSRPESVTRIGLAFQKLIVKRAVAFIFGNPVELVLKSDAETEQYKKIYECVGKIMDDVKINSLNRRVAKSMFSCTETAEIWYPVELKPNEDNPYNIDIKYKLRMRVLDPLKGDVLYPYFDDFGDMIAFSREYTVVKGSEKKVFFETYTDKLIYKYESTNGQNALVEGFPTENIIGKIPVVYGRQEETDFDDVQGLIDRLEKLLSNFGDTNDYHGAPTIFIQGSIKGFSKKGESGKIIEGDKDATAQYLSWTNAPESVKLEIETLINLIHSISQTPDISFEKVKGLGSGVSGKALKMMFLDAHLKVMDHMEVFDEYLQRRLSIVKAFIGIMDSTLKSDIKKVDIECVVTPYMIDDEADKISVLMTATGNKAVLSQKTGTKLAGFSVDADAEYQQIQSEEQAANTLNVFPSAK